MIPCIFILGKLLAHEMLDAAKITFRRLQDPQSLWDWILVITSSISAISALILLIIFLYAYFTSEPKKEKIITIRIK